MNQKPAIHHSPQKTDRAVSFTVDVDTVCHYLAAYAKPGPDCANLTYGALLPRFYDLFEKWNIKATFFVTGDHLIREENRNMIRRLADAGHEIANHTYSHPQRFCLLDLREKERQIAECEKAIEDIASARPAGFRAPAWDIDDETLAILRKRGYLYDSSCLPFAVTAIRPLLLGLKTKQLSSKPFQKDPWVLMPPKEPYRTDKGRCWKPGGDDFIELPVSMLPILRMPFISTWLFQWGDRATMSQTSLMASAGGWIQFGMHALDLIDLSTDPGAKSLSSIGHPVLKRSLTARRELLERIISALQADRKIVTLREQAKRILAGC